MNIITNELKLIKEKFSVPRRTQIIDAVLNYWHYNARLKSKGYRELISVKNILKDLGIKTQIPAIGWVFSENFGKNNIIVIPIRMMKN